MLPLPTRLAICLLSPDILGCRSTYVSECCARMNRKQVLLMMFTAASLVGVLVVRLPRA